jgi:alkylmercury lyase
LLRGIATWEQLTGMSPDGKLDLQRVAERIVGAFPLLDALEQRLSLDLYRLLAEAKPVPRPALAERAGISVENVERILDGWPGVFSDPQGRVVGYWGLSIPEAYASPHRFTIGGQTLSAWCAWDTLFLPQLLGQTARVESVSPVLGGRVRLTVTPARVEDIDPAAAQISFLLPDAAGVRKDVVTSFCHFVHFFPSRQAGESWTAQHPGTFMFSIEKALTLAKRKNAAQYPERFSISETSA